MKVALEFDTSADGAVKAARLFDALSRLVDFGENNPAGGKLVGHSQDGLRVSVTIQDATLIEIAKILNGLGF